MRDAFRLRPLLFSALVLCAGCASDRARPADPDAYPDERVPHAEPGPAPPTESYYIGPPADAEPGSEPIRTCPFRVYPAGKPPAPSAPAPAPRPTAALVPTATAQVTNAPWRAACRIRITAASYSVLGAGTVIVGDAKEAYLVTCAHIFEGAATPGEFKRKITVDLFTGEPRGKLQQLAYDESHTGECVDFDKTADLGLIRLRPGHRIESAAVTDVMPSKGQKLVAIGCGGGQDAIAWETEAIRGMRLVNGWTGVECKYPPRQGRSGGGLHTLDGKLVGVCDFVTPDGTGLYAGPASVKALLEKNGLADAVYPTGRWRGKDPEPVAPGTGIGIAVGPRPPNPFGDFFVGTSAVTFLVWVVAIAIAILVVVLVVVLVKRLVPAPPPGLPAPGAAPGPVVANQDALLLDILRRRSADRKAQADMDAIFLKMGPALDPNANPAAAPGAAV